MDTTSLVIVAMSKTIVRSLEISGLKDDALVTKKIKGSERRNSIRDKGAVLFVNNEWKHTSVQVPAETELVIRYGICL